MDSYREKAAEFREENERFKAAVARARAMHEEMRRRAVGDIQRLLSDGGAIGCYPPGTVRLADPPMTIEVVGSSAADAEFHVTLHFEANFGGWPTEPEGEKPETWRDRKSQL